jgi:signal transduction histidine kinase
MNDQTMKPTARWREVKHRIAHSIKLRMVLVFLLLAAAMTFVFISGAQKAFSVGWREAARPLLMDYVDRLAADVAGKDGELPSATRAQAIADRLPLVVRISGPQVNWSSHPSQPPSDWLWRKDEQAGRWDDENWGGSKDWDRILVRTMADGHRISFDINQAAFERRPRLIGYALTALLVLTLLAWLYVRRQLKPLDAIGEGARRFGKGDFSQPIPDRCCQAHDELGELATTINTMGRDIHQMLEAKRALLLAISHELRSPITRARLHAELLPEEGEAALQRQALLRDLQEMANLVSDLLESERLSNGHAALQREATCLVGLTGEVLHELQARHPAAASVTIQAPPDLPKLSVDRARMRLLLRNLLDNALRHGADAAQPPEVTLSRTADAQIIDVRDHGPGVPDEQLAQLAQAFYRPDSARTRAAGGVGLGLYLCRLVAQAHGGRLVLENARPGLRVRVELPVSG